MNIKLHTPKSLQTGSGLSSLKQFLLSLVATTISIVLTFGTAAIIENHKKNSDKKEMVMMVISDFDNTIESLQKTDSLLNESSRLQEQLALSPQKFDSLRFYFIPALSVSKATFAETTEKIFTTNVETFSTIGDVNFINDVSTFYSERQEYKNMVLNNYKKEVEKHPIAQSLNSLMNINFPDYALMNWEYLQTLTSIRNRCVKMMNVDEEDLIKFRSRQKSDNVETERDSVSDKKIKEWLKCKAVIEKAKENLHE